MTTSPQGLALIKHFESFFPKAYLCSAGVPTIGWGTIEYPDQKAVALGDTCTRDQADEWLQFELKEKEAAVLALTEGVELAQHQFDALVSFAYNVGIDNLKRSRLLRKLKVDSNDKTIVGSQNMTYGEWGRGGEFLRWCNAAGTPNRGLLRRRKAEAWLFATAQNRFFEEILTDKREASSFITIKKI
jgi:lysozyme